MKDPKNILKKNDPLTWTHYILLRDVEDNKERARYERFALTNKLNVEELEQGIASGEVRRRLTSDPGKPVDSGLFGSSSDFINDSEVLAFLEINNDGEHEKETSKNPLSEIALDTYAKGLISLEHGHSLAFKNKTVTVKGETHSIDLVFFNYNLNCFFLVKFLDHVPDRDDQESLIKSTNAFNRQNRPKGMNLSLGILIGKDSGKYLVVPAMKFTQVGIKSFYESYHGYIIDFANAFKI